MATSEDRVNRLRASAEQFTGIDFVQVVDPCEQVTLRVFFLTDPRLLRPPFEDLGDPSNPPTPVGLQDVRIFSPRDVVPDVSPAALSWGEDTLTQRRYLELRVESPGEFTDYALRIDDKRVERSFNDVSFSFKAGCDSGFDCARVPNDCVHDAPVDVPIDYLARDFTSLSGALLDFAAQRYPNWSLPIEADTGRMLLELLAALGDELSYVQDRFNREAYLETATERRTLRRKARLVDHEIHDGCMASTLLELDVLAGVTSVPAGARVWVQRRDAAPITFELGSGLRDRGSHFAVNAAWNHGKLKPYAWDDDERCLPAGATSVFVRNDPANPDNPSGIGFDVAATLLWVDRWLLLREVSDDPSRPEKQHAARVVSVEFDRDALFGIDLVRIRWADEHALPFDVDLSVLDLSGNLVPACAGESRRVHFRIGALQTGDVDTEVIEAVERQGPLFSSRDPSLLERRNACDDAVDVAVRPTIYLMTLPDTDASGLAFALGPAGLRASSPELRLFEVASVTAPAGLEWDFRRSLLHDGPDDRVFTLEDGSWRRITAFRRGGIELPHRDYASGGGYTIRTADGQFGQLPRPGMLYRAEYRLGAGQAANVASGSVRALSVPGQISDLAALVSAVKNPFPVTSGVDPESHAQIKQLAPYTHALGRLFAVRPEDYGEQAETLSFVQRAQGHFRWTGSWLSAVVAADPEGGQSLASERRIALETLLDCRRQVGREVIVSDPRYADLDLEITICVERSAFVAHVKRQALDALFGTRGARPTQGLFHPDSFTFGSPLRRSLIEARLLSVPGVHAVVDMRVRRHGVADYQSFDRLSFEVESDEVIRLENDPLRPERGSLTLLFQGGA